MNFLHYFFRNIEYSTSNTIVVLHYCYTFSSYFNAFYHQNFQFIIYMYLIKMCKFTNFGILKLWKLPKSPSFLKWLRPNNPFLRLLMLIYVSRLKSPRQQPWCSEIFEADTNEDMMNKSPVFTILIKRWR